MQKLLTLALVALSVSTLSARIFEADPSVIFSSATTYADSKIGFEMINKSKQPIWFVIVNGDELSNLYSLDGLTNKRHEIRLSNIDISQPTKLAVWFSNPGPSNKIDYSRPFGLPFGQQKPKVFTPTPNRVYSFIPNRTIYLTWDEKNIARPQSGPLKIPGMSKGILGKTDSNLSLEINVTPNDIKEEPTA